MVAEDEEEDGVTADLPQNKLKHMVDIQTKDKVRHFISLHLVSLFFILSFLFFIEIVFLLTR
jgi:hypothetical protein